MKKTYENPFIEVTPFVVADVLTTSEGDVPSGPSVGPGGLPVVPGGN